MTTVRDIYEIVDRLAPFVLREVWDNVGLLCGSMENPVSGILCALDLTEAVLSEALDKKANLIITHHPILFGGRKNLREDDAEGRLLCRMVRNHMNLIAAHTNYDAAREGVNDCLARALGLREITEIEEAPFLRVGVHETMSLRAFAAEAAEKLGDVVRVYGEPDKPITRVAVCGGAGGEYYKIAKDAGADAYLTGEMRYHDSMDAAAEGFCTLNAGHDATERIAVKPLRDRLQNEINALQYKVTVYVSDLEGTKCS